jgi:hypothetical protein
MRNLIMPATAVLLLGSDAANVPGRARFNAHRVLL